MVSAEVVYGYAQAARVLSGLYLVAQLIVLLDFIYRLNGSLVDREGCVAVLLSLTTACYAGALVSLGFQYHMFAPSPSCGLNIFLITFTLILGIAASIVSVLPKRNQSSGLFTAAAVFLYASFLSYSALNSEPNSGGQCERSAGTQDTWITVIPSAYPLSCRIWEQP